MGIECDVKLTKDGKMVIMHDKTLNRTCRNASDYSKIQGKVAIEELTQLYVDYYAKDSFTHITPANIDLKQVVNTNKALVHIDKVGNKAVITCIIDNLLTGAVGQAVQNMNLMFGIDETAGLRLKASAF